MGAKRGRPPSSTLREDVLDAGMDLLAEGTPLTIRALSEQVRKTQQAIYLFFRRAGGRERHGGISEIRGLLAARGFSDLTEALRRTDRPGESGEDSLARLAGAYIRFAVDRPALFRLMFGDDPPPDAWPPELTAARAQVESLLQKRVQGAMADERDREGTTWRVAWALAHGIATLTIDQQPHFASTPPAVRVAARNAARLLAGQWHSKT